MSRGVKGENDFSLFWKCILASVAVHATVIALLMERPIWLSSLWQTFLGKIPSRVVDLSLPNDPSSQSQDTTFDVFFTKRPFSKPFDLPQEALDALAPQGEYVASSLTWSDPLLEPTQTVWSSVDLAPLSREESPSDMALASFLVPILEAPHDRITEATSLLFAAPDILLQEGEQDAPYVAATARTEVDIQPVEVTFSAVEEQVADHPLPKSLTQRPALSFPPPQMESLVFPALALSITAPSEQIPASLLPPLTMEIAASQAEDSLFLSSPKQETLASLGNPLSLPSPTHPLMQFSPPENLQKPQLSSPTIPLENTLSYVPNFAFGNLHLAPPRTYGLPKLANATIAEWQDLFEIDVHIMPRKKEGDLLFSIVLTPKQETLVHTFRQNYHFIIDCSKDTSNHRVPVYKRAVQRAISQLDDKQNFNIYLLDQHGVEFQRTPLPCTESHLAKARDFLEKEKYSRKAPKSDLLSVLKQIANLPKKNDEVHTVILLSDGNSLAGKEKKEGTLYSWLRNQRGKITFYAATIEDDSRLLDLQLYTAASGGKVLVSQTHAAFARKFTKMVMDLQYPLATHISVDIRSKNPKHPLTLASSQLVFPPLFVNQHYTLIGSAQSEEDFTFFLEAQAKDRFVEISKHLSLKNATGAASSLTPLWLETKAQGALAHFLEKDSEHSMKQAAEWLEQAKQRTHRR